MDSTDLIGRTISHYQVLAKLGEGGMGVVFRAVDVRLDRIVALKVLAAKLTDPERKKRFAQEAKTASSLNHPNIITIYDIGTEGELDFIAMEYVAGNTLDQLIGGRGLRLPEVLNYAVQIADALSAAHAAGIVHRDLKPANVMVTVKGRVKVLDFGLAKLAERAPADDLTRTIVLSDMSPRTIEGAIVGTVIYMSPEQAEGKRVDGRSDIFSFGTVLYEMVTGRRPFQGDTPLSSLAAILNKEPRPISDFVEASPQEIDKLISRCLRKDPERRIQHMDDVKLALEELKEESESGVLVFSPSRQPSTITQTAPPPARSRIPKLVGFGLILLLVIGGVTWWSSRRSTAPIREPVLTRLTSDSGLSAYPALSPDGRLLAYASDRGGQGNLDIWVQQVGGGEPIQLTNDEADDYEPAFSPDGTKIAFRSERDGGGMYVISALGGEARLIVRQGRRPVFSPDGKWIAYWVGAIDTGVIPGSAKIYVVAATGGQPWQLHPEFTNARHPAWMPDGQHVLFFGRVGENEPRQQDWWVTLVDFADPSRTAPAVKTGASRVFSAQNLSPPPGEFAITPGTVSPDGDRIVFSASLGDSANLWQIPISTKTGQAAGAAQRLTFGTGLEVHPSAAGGPAGARQVFSSLTLNVDIWSLPLDANRGKPAGELKPLTPGVSFHAYPSISADGKKLVYVTPRSGNLNVWLRNLESGKETALTAGGLDKIQPKMSGDATRVVYSEKEGRKRMIFLLSTSGGVAEKLCEGHCGVPTHISRDGQKVLIESVGSPDSIILADVASGKQVDQIVAPQHPEFFPFAARFSPDERWISFHVRTASAVNRQVFVVPFRSGTTPAESDWIPITDGASLDWETYWSPDGNLLYFLSDRDGFRCIWAQRLHPATKRPIGQAFAVQHFHHARRSLARVGGGGAGAVGMSVAPGKMVFAMGEITGNIWMSKAEGQP